MKTVENMFISSATMGAMKRKYWSLPNGSMEFGGLICGYRKGNRIYVNKFIDMAPLFGSADAYSFDPTVLKRGNLCSPYRIVGLWHTHPPYSPYPSSEDRDISESLHTIGCVVTDSMRCFHGKKDIPVFVKDS